MIFSSARCVRCKQAQLCEDVVDECDPYSSDNELSTNYGVVSDCSKK
jgi:hypothetical protein